MLSIRALKKEELNLLFKHAYDAKLDVEELHLRCQYTTHSDDFFIAHKDDDLVGFIVALRHSDEFAFISNFLILPEFQKRGYGTLLLEFALEHLQNRQIALDSDALYKSFYEKAGFRSYFDVDTFLYITKKDSLYHTNLTFKNYQESTSTNKTNPFLQCLVHNEKTTYISLETEEILPSYGVSFTYKDGYKIVIDTQKYEHAKAIFFKLTQKFERGISIYIEATKLNPIFLNLAYDLEMILFSKSSRMYNKV